MTSNPASVGPAPDGLLPCPKRGELRVINGQQCRFIERELEGDKWEVLGAPHPDREAEPTGGVVGDWEIDRSTGTDILMFQKCSVIEDEQAHRVMRTLAAPQPPRIRPEAVARILAFAEVHEQSEDAEDREEAAALTMIGNWLSALSVSPPVVGGNGSLQAQAPSVPTECPETAVVGDALTERLTKVAYATEFLDVREDILALVERDRKRWLDNIAMCELLAKARAKLADHPSGAPDRPRR